MPLPLPDEVKDIFKEMNEKLDEVIDKWENETIDEEELKNLLLKIKFLKDDAIDIFPAVFGRSFLHWYICFMMLDKKLSEASLHTISRTWKSDVTEFLKNAKVWKDRLEKAPGEVE